MYSKSTVVYVVEKTWSHWYIVMRQTIGNYAIIVGRDCHFLSWQEQVIARHKSILWLSTDEIITKVFGVCNLSTDTVVQIQPNVWNISEPDTGDTDNNIRPLLLINVF